MSSQHVFSRALQIYAQDHAIRLIEAWMEASLDPFFGALNRLNDQMQSDAATREELGGLGRFVEGQLKGTAFKDSEEEVVSEAKDRFGRVRERLLSTWVACLLLCSGGFGGPLPSQPHSPHFWHGTITSFASTQPTTTSRSAACWTS